MQPASLPPSVLLGAVSVPAALAVVLSFGAARRAHLTRVRRVWTLACAATGAAFAALVLADVAALTGRAWPTVPIELVIALFAVIATGGALHAAKQGGLPPSRTVLDAVPPGLAVAMLAVLQLGHDVDRSPRELIGRVLLPVVAGSLAALTLDAAMASGGRRTSLNVALLAGGLELCAVAIVADSVLGGQLQHPPVLAVWGLGLGAVAVAALRRAEASAGAIPASDPYALGAGAVGAVAAVAALLAMDTLLAGNDPEWQYGLTTVAMLCLAARLTVDRAAVRRLLREVRGAEQRYRTLVEQLPLITYVARLEGDDEHVYVSPQVDQVLGYPPDAWAADPVLLAKLLHPDDSDRVRAWLDARRAAADGQWTTEYRLISRDGRVVWIEDRATVVRDADTGPALAQGYLRDITERKAADQALREGREELADSERRFREILENVQLLAVTFDLDGRIQFVNDHLCAVTGWPREALVGHSVLGTLTDNRELVDAILRDMREGSVPAHVARAMRTRGGDELVVAWNDTMVRDRDGRVVALTRIGEDVTARRRAEQRIAYLAGHDALTGLPNRTAFAERVEAAMALAARHDRAVAVLFVDIDNFQLVNDGYSHTDGDTLLKELAARLRDVGASAAAVARHSGDEFLLLLADMDERSDGGAYASADAVARMAAALADRIQASLQTPFTLPGDPVYMTCKVGVSLFPRDARDTNQLLSHAHIASYGDHRRAAMLPKVATGAPPRDELRLVAHLHRALDRDELALHYQPVVELDSRRIVGVEALLRWRSPDGLVPPSRFIPLAERTGLIAPITDWVVDRVCRQRAAWRARGIDLEIAFNFPATLWEPAVIRAMLATIAGHGVDPAELLVEITESTATIEGPESQAMMDLITSSGLRLAIDDFGTGYSSLARLKQLPCRTLKVDRSLVADLPRDADSAAMTLAIVQLAGNLDIDPLAEGIETEAQAAFLSDVGCRLGQGFLFGRAMPAEELEAHLRREWRDAA